MNLAYKTIERSGYYSGDAREFVKTLKDCSIDVTITSPPYGSMKDYGTKSQIGFGQSYEQYLDSLSSIFSTLHSKTKDTGSLWIVVDTFKQNKNHRLLPFDLINRLTAVNWHLQDIIIWNKTKTLPWSRPGQFRKIFEYVLFFSKGIRFNYFIDRIKEPDDLKEWWVKYPERYSPEGKVPSTIWTFPIPVQGSWSKSAIRHACPFPASLVERILLLTTQETHLVFDPFAGTGTVLAQAQAMRRKFIGCDLNDKFREQFLKVTRNHISDQWKNGRVATRQLEDGRTQLAQTIKKLREVKYPKALYKELSKCTKDSNSRIKAIVAKSVPISPNGSRSFAKIFVFVLVEGDSAEILQRARKIASRAPLSKFGLTAEIAASSVDGFLKSKDGCLLQEQSLFVYLEGKTHYAHSSTTLADIVQFTNQGWKKCPPIFANVEVKQLAVKTWKATNGTH